MRIAYHSDRAFFAGCENMLANFFNDDNFMTGNNVSFSYRSSDSYKSGFRNRVNRKFKTIALKLPNMYKLYSYIDKVPFIPIRLFVKVLASILLIKPPHRLAPR